jgi:hypothetical protein
MTYLNLCRSCGCDFASVSGFDRHRAGSYQYTFSEGLELDPLREDGRRCLDADEMHDAPAWHPTCEGAGPSLPTSSGLGGRSQGPHNTL